MDRVSAIELVIRMDLSGTVLPHTSLEKEQFHGYKFGPSIKIDLVRCSAIPNVTPSYHLLVNRERHYLTGLRSN